MRQTVVIVGAGEIGRTINKILLNKEEVTIYLWDRNSSKVPGQKPLKQTLPQADFLFLCVPSWAVRAVLRNITPLLREKTVIISLAKGLEKKTAKTMAQVLTEALPSNHPFALLGGPMLAEELTSGLKSVGVFASRKKENFERAVLIFKETNLQLKYSSDLCGVSLCGVLKNIYALGLGMVEALSLGNNFKGWFVQKAIEEMGEIIEIFGGRRETAYQEAGLGDLVATGFSSYSRNRQIGKMLVETDSAGLKSEGLISLPPLLTLLGKKRFQFKLLTVLERVILKKEKAKRIFSQLKL